MLNDLAETLAMKAVFGQSAYSIPISSTKSMIGHCTTGCGAVELVVALLAARNGVIPPTINYETPDPECDLDYVPNVARQQTCRHVLSNSLGFGGQTSALIVSRFDQHSVSLRGHRASHSRRRGATA
jgi:3-oxoacyl-[acyl-carrier-protein] synthase II